MSGARGAGAGAVPSKPLHLPAAEQVVRFDLLPGGDTEGTRRGVANGIATSCTMVNLLVMPPGQTSPRRRFTGDHVIYQLSGTIEWAVGDEVFRLSPNDMLFFPPGTPYSFANVGDTEARFLDVAGKVDDWPPRMQYEDGTEIDSGTLDDLFN